MKKKAIIFLAWKACERNSVFFSKNPFQYESALFLILLTGIVHLFQGLLVINFFSLFKKITHIGAGEYILMYAIFIILFFVCRAIFSKNVLTEAIELYEGSKMGKYAKIIVYPYFVVNFTLLMAIIIWRAR